MRLSFTLLLASLTACFDGGKDDAAGAPDDEAPAVDQDGDGVLADDDCDDANPGVYPGAEEVCDEADNDCDGEVDEGVTTTFFADADADTFGDAAAPIEACALPAGAADNADDCDDAQPTVFPGNPETCDELDNDCDGTIDDGVTTTFFADADADTFGDAAAPIEACALADGLADNADDCDDTEPTVFPGNPETCDELDNDCDGTVDDGVTTTFWADADADTFGDAAAPTEACALPAGAADNADDCDDTEPTVFPGNPETCDELDNDCDGTVDDGVTTTFFADTDADGFGDLASTTEACAVPSGFVADDTDCDDTEPTVFPGNPETCDELDNDCDGTIDDGVTTTFFADTDADGFGDLASTTEACAVPSGFVADDTDCDDTEPTVFPGNPETCDELDNDCDGTVDDGVTTTFYIDADADGYGDAANTVEACAVPSGASTDATDCDDSQSGVNPGATEIPFDGTDQNCEGNDGPLVSLSAATGSLVALEGYDSTGASSFTVSNPGEGTLGFDVSADQTWVSLSATGGTEGDAISVEADASGLSAGTHTATVTVADDIAGYTTGTFAVSVEVAETWSGDATFDIERDLRGDITQVTDPTGAVLSVTRDGLGRATDLSSSTGDFATLTYDAMGNPTSLENGEGTLAVAYTLDDQVDTITWPGGGVMTYTWDASGRVEELLLPSGDAITYDYTSSETLLPDSVSSTLSGTISYTYDADARVTGRTLADGTTTTTTYDATTGRTAGIVHADSAGTTLLEFAQTYDSQGRISTITRGDGVSSETRTYTYDAMGRLDGVTSTAGDTWTFTYDDAGNRTALTENTDSTDYLYDSDNRLLQAGDEVFEYDAAGRMTARVSPSGTTTYTWDAFNRLVEADDGSSVVTYAYAADGTRISRDVDGVTTTYYHDLQGTVPALVQAETVDGTTTSTATYVRGHGLAFVDVDGTGYGVLSDHKGSVYGLRSGSSLYEFGYTPFGDTAAAPTTLDESALWLSFNGEERDPVTGLVYLRNRYYDPDLGRFVSPDQRMPDDATTGSWNAYVYCESDPINYIDPTGRVRWDYVATGLVSIATGVAVVGAVIVGVAAAPAIGTGAAIMAGVVAVNSIANVAFGTARVVGGLAMDASDQSYIPSSLSDVAAHAIKQNTDNPGLELMATAGSMAIDTFLLGPPKWAEVPRWAQTLSQIMDGKSVVDLGRDAIPHGLELYIDPNTGGLYADDGNGLVSLDPSAHGDDVRGGIYLNATAQVVGDLSQVDGAAVDPTTGQLVLFGEDGGYYSVDGVSGDLLMTALQWVHSSVEDGTFVPPGVTIEHDLVPTEEPTPPDSTHTYHGVGYFGGIEYTEMGFVAFEADRMLKSLDLCEDNEDLTDYGYLSTSISGFECNVDLYEDYYDGSSPAGWVRFWIEPDEMVLTVDASRDAIRFTTATMQVQYEDQTDATQTWPQYDYWTEMLTDQYDDVAVEVPSWEELRTAGKMVAVAYYLYENDLHQTMNWDWINAYEVDAWDTPWWTLEGEVTSTITYQGSSIVTTHRGGASTSTFEHSYQADTGSVEALVDEVLDARPDDLTDSWTYTAPDGSTGAAVGVPMNKVAVDGGAHLIEPDLVARTPGVLPLAVLRTYASVLAADGFDLGMGPGWSFVPASLTPSTLVNSSWTIDLPYTVELHSHVTGKSFWFTFTGTNSSTGLAYWELANHPDDALTMDATGVYTWGRADGSELTFDADGQLLSHTTPLGESLLYTWTSAELDTIEHDSGEVLTLTWSGGLLTQAETDDGRVVTYGYDAAGYLTSVTDADSDSWTLSYDADGLLTSVVAGDGSAAFAATYDDLGRAVTQSVLGRELATSGSLLDGNTILEDGSGVSVLVQLDEDGRLESITDGEAGEWSYAWTTDGLIDEITDPEGNLTTYEYDGYDNLYRVTDGEGDQRRYWWTWSGDAWVLFAYEEADGDQWYVNRNTDGTIASILQATVSTDSSGALTGVSLPSAAAQQSATYDSDGALLTWTMGTLTQTMTWTADGQLDTLSDPFGAETAYTYDTAGRVSQVTSGEGVVVAYTYDGAQTRRLASVSVGGVTAASFTWDGLGRLTSLTDADGNLTTYTWGTDGALSLTEDPQGASVGFTRDGAGRLTDLAASWGQAHTYTYDDAGRLASMTRTVALP